MKHIRKPIDFRCDNYYGAVAVAYQARTKPDSAARLKSLFDSIDASTSGLKLANGNGKCRLVN